MRISILVLALSALCACKRDDSPEKVPVKREAPAEPSKGEAQPEAKAEDQPQLIRFDFDSVPPGPAPDRLKIAETNGAGTPASWTVRYEDDAPSPPHIFGISKTVNTGQTYNLALIEDLQLADVDVSVMLKADTGVKDQGGGVVFRAQGPTDYYVARWNPLENNARFYIVENSHRSALAKVELELDPDRWHAMRVVAEGHRFELFLDDRSVLSIEDDTFDRGTAGLWTKSDAATWFDDFTVTPL